MARYSISPAWKPTRTHDDPWPGTGVMDEQEGEFLKTILNLRILTDTLCTFVHCG